jgi:hypothetical protein
LPLSITTDIDSLLIPIVDTWFGVTVHPAIITQLYNDTTTHSYGLQINETRCVNSVGEPIGAGDFDNPYWGGEWKPCNLRSSLGGPFSYVGMYGADEASRIAAGRSNHHEIRNFTSNDTTYFYLADIHANAKRDFKAQTYAMTTSCKPVTSRCQPGSKWPYTRDDESIVCSPGFNTSFGFTGRPQRKVPPFEPRGDKLAGATLDDVAPLVGIGFSPDAQLSTRIGAWNQAWHDANNISYSIETETSYDPVCEPNGPLGGTCFEYIRPNNPLHFATWATGYPTIDDMGDDSPTPLLDDHEIYQAPNGGPTFWVLQCEAHIYDLTYTWVNGTIHTFHPTLASPAVGGLISGPFAFALAPAQLAMSSISQLAGLAPTASKLADIWANGFSSSALAMSIGAWTPKLNEFEQIRNATVAVSRIPIIPLYFLLGFKLIYVLAVVILAIGCYAFTHPAETEVVKAQLSTKGLAAAHFEEPGLLQGNVVQSVQDRLALKRANTSPNAGPTNENGEANGEKGLKRAKTMPTEQKKVGLVLDKDGAWQFATVVNGVWNSVKPIAETILVNEARAGGMGGFGDVVRAWK